MLLRDSAVYVVSRALPGGFGFATAVLLTWFLPPEAFGLYGMGMAIVMMASSVAFDWLGACVMRWFETHRDEPSFMPTVLALFVGMGSTAALSVLLASLFGLTSGHGLLACILLFGTVANGWFEFAARIQICQSEPTRFLYLMLFRSGVILAGGVLVADLTRSAEATLLFSFSATAAAGCLFLFTGPFRIWTKSNSRGFGLFGVSRGFDPGLAREFAAFGAPVGLTMVFGGLATTATPILIGALADYQAVGAFTIGLTIVQSTLGVIASGISSAAYPAAVRAVEGGDPSVAEATLARNYTLLLALLLPAGVGLAMLSSGIARAFVEPQYHEALARTMPWLAAAAVLMGLRATYVDFAFHLGKRTGYLIQVMGLAAAINLCLGAALIPALREVGASIAICCAFGAALIHAALLARHAHPMPLPLKETCGILLATALMVGALWAIPVGVPGPLGLAQQVLCGVTTYAATLGALAALAPGPGHVGAVLRSSGLHRSSSRLRQTLSVRNRWPRASCRR